MRSRTEFWLEQQEWKNNDLTGQYIFLLDAIHRYGASKFNQEWQRHPGYWRRKGTPLPKKQSEASAEQRCHAHQLLRCWKKEYEPNFMWDHSWDSDRAGFVERDTGRYHFSDDDWDDAVLTAHDGIAISSGSIQQFEDIVKLLIRAAATKNLKTFSRPKFGKFAPIESDSWNGDFDDLRIRFAFGEFDPSDPASDSAQGPTWIYVSATDLSKVITGKVQGGNPTTTEAERQECREWLIKCRKAGRPIGTRAQYLDAAQQAIGISETHFDQEWLNAAKAEPLAKGWGKRPSAKAFRPIRFREI